MLQVTINDQPNQIVAATIAGQAVSLAIQQRATGLFMDVASNGAVVISGVICENLNRIVRDLYLGFSGDFVFVDTQGSSDPSYPGLGSRWLLIYLDPSELAGEG